MRLGAQFLAQDFDEYLASVRWDRHWPLTISVQNRLQNELVLLKVDPKTGKTTELVKETDKAFVNIDPDMPRWIDGGDFLWSRDTADGTQLERRAADGKLKRVVVLEALPVTAVGKIFKPTLRDLAINEKARLEIERVFGEGVSAEIIVDKDEKLNTRVRIVVATNDNGRLRELAESLASLPQNYLVEGHAQ